MFTTHKSIIEEKTKPTNMREDHSNWFTKWEDELPSPEELTPLSQTLISPDLALAFNISSHAPPQPSVAPPLFNSQSLQNHHHTPSSEFDSPELSSGPGGGGSGGGPNSAGDELARTLKRPRLVWTPQLHKRFVDAVAHLGIKNAVPKTIMQLMSVDGLTRENVASHLQKYRLYLKRMQGMSAGGGGGGGGSSVGTSGAGVVDPATDHLFASGPVPAHFLHSAAFVPVANHHGHGGGMVVHPYGHFGNSPPNGTGGFENSSNNSLFLMRQQQQQQQRVGIMPLNNGGVGGYDNNGENLETVNGTYGRKVLTLFPTGVD